MATPSSGSVLLLLLFLVTAAILPSHASLISVKAVRVRGLLVCSANGNLTPQCTTCRGLAGVNVNITCNGATTRITQVVTDSSGFFNAVLNFVDGLVFDTNSSPCFVTVKLPIAKCVLLPPTGILRAPVTFLGTVVESVIGLVAEVVSGLFVHV
ncbi:uncharacterized protein [Henckelia pumila]|uniref:uncharacterized protein n=1 Tax=Henckelia pumila TaxID=405737 RepID=UPI003C6E0E3C